MLVAVTLCCDCCFEGVHVCQDRSHEHALSQEALGGACELPDSLGRDPTLACNHRFQVAKENEGETCTVKMQRIYINKKDDDGGEVKVR